MKQILEKVLLSGGLIGMVALIIVVAVGPTVFAVWVAVKLLQHFGVI